MEYTYNILYEDNHVLVVDKPCGLLSQKENENEFDILDLYKKYIKDKYNKPSNVYLGLVSRLDRNVSGLMVLSKTSKAHERLNLNRPKKRYYALVYGRVEEEKELIDYLSKDKNAKKAIIDKNGKRSVLRYKIIDKNDLYSLLDVEIDTGRFHQIRCQLSNAGFPILNDTKYSNKDKSSNDLGLDAYYVEFIHPVTKKTMIFERKSRLKI